MTVDNETGCCASDEAGQVATTDGAGTLGIHQHRADVPAALTGGKQDESRSQRSGHEQAIDNE